MNIAKKLTEALKPKRQTSGYDTVAVVKRIEGGTAWVGIEGGVDETPVKMSINVNPGDNVNVRVDGGKAWITGNNTAPPADGKSTIYYSSANPPANPKENDTWFNPNEDNAIYRYSGGEWKKEPLGGKAIRDRSIAIEALNDDAKEEVDTANGQITIIDGGGISVHEAGNETESVNIKGDGIHIVKGGKEVASFGSDVIIGNTNFSRQKQTDSGVEYINSENETVGKIEFGGAHPDVVNKVVPIESAYQEGSATLPEADDTVTDAIGLNAHITTSGGYSYETGENWITWLDGYSGQFRFTGTPWWIRFVIDATNKTVSWELTGAQPIEGFSSGYIQITLNEGLVADSPKFAFGEGTKANSENQFVVGKYNVEDTDDELRFIVGNGYESLGSEFRNNAFAVGKDGTARARGAIYGWCGANSRGGTNVCPSYEIDDTQSAVKTQTGTAKELDEISLTKGIWIIQASVSFASNATGIRRAWLSTSSGGTMMAIRACDNRTAISGVATICHVTCIVYASSNTTLHLVGYQTSGGELNATPRWAKFGNEIT